MACLPFRQAVVQPLTRAAIFLVVTVNPGELHQSRHRPIVLRGPSGANTRCGFPRHLRDALSCVMAFGSDVWDRLFGPPRGNQTEIAYT